MWAESADRAEKKTKVGLWTVPLLPARRGKRDREAN